MSNYNCKCPRCLESNIRDLKWQWEKIHMELTHRMYEKGSISDEEYKKFLLDEK